MRRNKTGRLGPNAVEAERLRRLLAVNAACGDLGEDTLARFADAIDAAEDRAPAARRKAAAA